MRVSESPESASPMVTRAVASALADVPFQSLDLPDWQRRILGLADQVTPKLLPKLVQFENRRRALPPKAAADVDVERLAADRVADYHPWQGTSSSVVMGSSLGGAAAYLSAALGAPFLPEPFILAFRGGSAVDEVEPHLERAIELAEIVSIKNPSANLISHFDPVHDGWLTGYINHLRLKLGHIPPSYKDFIDQHLEPGGTIVHLNCQAEWLGYRLNERHRYQIGGWGGIPPREYRTGSPRIDQFLADKGSTHRGGWRVPGMEPTWGPESEWGSAPDFASALQALAEEHGYRYQSIKYRVPHHYSLLAYFAVTRLYKNLQIEPTGVFIGMFNQYDPSAVLARGLLPLWLVFNTEDSLYFLREMTPLFPQLPIQFSALVTFSQTPDMVSWQQWQQALKGLHWESIGARRDRYPMDAVSLWGWQERLLQIPSHDMGAARQRMTPAALSEEMDRVDRFKSLVPSYPLSNSSGK